MAKMKDKLKELRREAEVEAKAGVTMGMTKEEREALQKKMQEEEKKPARPKYDPNKPETYKKGGSVSSRADGCCIKGKTRGKMV